MDNNLHLVGLVTDLQLDRLHLELQYLQQNGDLVSDEEHMKYLCEQLENEEDT